MKKMMPLFFILAIVVLAGIGVAGYAMRKASIKTPSPTQTLSPSGTPSSQQQQGISLVISSPANGLEVATPNVTVTGQTAPNAEVFVNDAAGRADAIGYFAIGTSLDEGENTVIVVVNDANGNFAEQEITVTYNAGT
ncbi:hypothetical protein HYV22_01330 [Candidatus Gottesmanbacteria bacterium]|nr:hypothetical protein [Candidatus Gottesmanbacteria bacterium]